MNHPRMRFTQLGAEPGALEAQAAAAGARPDFPELDGGARHLSVMLQRIATAGWHVAVAMLMSCWRPCRHNHCWLRLGRSSS